MASSSTRALKGAIDLQLSEVLRYDFWGALPIGLGGGVALALLTPDRLGIVMPIVVGIVGVIIGAVVAGVAVIAAFLDSVFLRKIKAMNADRVPTYYFGPLIFTAVIGVIACILALPVVAIPGTAPGWLMGPLAGVAGFFTVWTILSLIPALGTLTEFVLLKDDAAQVPDSAVAEPVPASH